MKMKVGKLTKLILQSLFPETLLLHGRENVDTAIALTFDDGPHNEYTNEVLQILRKENVKATFFVVGKEAEKYPELVKTMTRTGHEVANHSYAHSKNGGIEDVEKAKRIIEQISKTQITLFRPPWGKVTFGKLWYAISNKIKIVLWSFDSLDDKFRSPEELKEYIRNSEIVPGDILLFHEDYRHTKEALPDIIDNLKSRGFKFSTVSELLG